MEPTNYQSRVHRLLENKPNTVALLKAAPEMDYFQQDANFRYFCGLNEPDSYLVLSNIEGKINSHLFLREKDPYEEMWHGKRLGVEKATELLDVTYAYPLKDYQIKVPELLHGHHTILCDFKNKELLEEIRSLSNSLESRRKIKKFIPKRIEDINFHSGSLRLKKDDNEIQFLKKACDLTSVAHKTCMALAKKGLNESELDRTLSYIFKKDNGSGSAYENIVAGGVNALTLHYCSNNQELKDGDLVLIDAGAKFNGYCSDVTRTFPINGHFSEAQKKIYQYVLEAQKATINLSKPGVSFSKLHECSVYSLTSALVELEILAGTIEENIENMTYREFYPHGTGHWLGLDVHDNCPYLDENLEEIILEEGMVFTVEPGLYFPLNHPKVPSQYQGIGIRIEDDILVTKEGHLNLTASIPKEVKEIEEACSKEFLL